MMKIPFFDRAQQIGFNITQKSHPINHANSKIIIKPNFPEFGIEIQYIIKVLKQLATICYIIISKKRGDKFFSKIW